MFQREGKVEKAWREGTWGKAKKTEHIKRITLEGEEMGRFLPFIWKLNSLRMKKAKLEQEITPNFIIRIS